MHLQPKHPSPPANERTRVPPPHHNVSARFLTAIPTTVVSQSHPMNEGRQTGMKVVGAATVSDGVYRTALTNSGFDKFKRLGDWEVGDVSTRRADGLDVGWRCGMRCNATWEGKMGYTDRCCLHVQS